jgi:hypothetical protein
MLGEVKTLAHDPLNEAVINLVVGDLDTSLREPASGEISKNMLPPYRDDDVDFVGTKDLKNLSAHFGQIILGVKVERRFSSFGLKRRYTAEVAVAH